MKYVDFLKQVPSEGYHVPNGEVDVFSEKNLSFECGCGLRHSVHTATAVIDSGLTNKVVYICPSDENIFNLVKAAGFFSIKDLETLASYKSENNEQRNKVILALESRKKHGR